MDEEGDGVVEGADGWADNEHSDAEELACFVEFLLGLLLLWEWKVDVESREDRDSDTLDRLPELIKGCFDILFYFVGDSWLGLDSLFLFFDRGVAFASGLSLRLVPNLQLVPVVGVHEAEAELD